MMNLKAAAVAPFAALALAACGNAEPPKPPAPPPEHAIYSSTQDCLDAGKMKPDYCEKIIDAGVTMHAAQAPVFKTLRMCEGAMGPERCGKGSDGSYRPLLRAFYITLSDPPHVEPLYLPGEQKAAFQKLDKKQIMANDETLYISNNAITLANENAKIKPIENNGEVAEPKI